MKLTFIQWVNFPRKSNITLWENTRALCYIVMSSRYESFVRSLLKIHGLERLYDAIEDRI